MRKLILCTITLMAIGAMYFAPVMVEASDPLGLPTIEKACTSCHSDIKPVMRVDLDTSIKASATITDIGVTADNAHTLFPKAHGVYMEPLAFNGLSNRYTIPFYTGSSKVPI